MVLLLPFALVRFCWKNRSNPEALRRWRERLGLLDFKNNAADLIWIHAVSVGESNVAQPLIDRLKSNYPGVEIVVSTTTATGARTVMSRHGTEVTHIYFPFDIKTCIAKCFDKLAPQAIILIETELWPNFLAVAEERAVPVALINARLSEKAARRYRKFPQLMEQMLRRLDLIAAQSPDDAGRFEALGADQEKVFVTGSMKFDRELVPSTRERGEAIRRELGTSRFVLMAGSTRDGEEALLLEQLPRLLERIPDFLLVIAPRHPERFDTVAELLDSQGISNQRYQDGRTVAAKTSVFLLDVMGELTNYYAAADIAFVGGSLKPLGGQNTLEPAGLGVPILVGPHTYNFASVNGKLADAGALLVAEDPEQLTKLAIELSLDSNQRDRMGLSGKRVFKENRGALNQVEALLAPLLASVKA